MKKLLVDGTNLSHIHFAANPTLDNDGNPAGIIKGFLSAMSRINKIYGPNEIVVFFDGPGGSAQRRSIYKEYKQGRKGRVVVGQQYQFASPESAEKNYDWQVAITTKFLNYCGIKTITTSQYETDDGIAYVVNSNKDDECLIVSCDKDFYQLLSERVRIYNPIMKDFIDSKWVMKKFEVPPNNWLFYRAVDGDVSDNINGVKGFGPKTLKKLFSLDSENKIPLDSIPGGVTLLRESCADSKEKRILKRLEQLNAEMELLKRNWKLMDLSDPLMSLKHKEQVDNQLKETYPLNIKDFYGNIAILGIGINPMMPSEFVRLKS